MNKKNRYIPDTLVTPGDVVEDYLESYAMTQFELANRTGLSKKAINEIIKGKAPITSTTALKFERTLGRPAHFWNNLERQYQENLERITERKTLEKNLEWLKAMPTNEMIKLGWIKKHTDKLQQLEELLIFFRIASPQQWKTVYNNHQVAFRRSKKLKTLKNYYLLGYDKEKY